MYRQRLINGPDRGIYFIYCSFSLKNYQIRFLTLVNETKYVSINFRVCSTRWQYWSFKMMTLNFPSLRLRVTRPSWYVINMVDHKHLSNSVAKIINSNYNKQRMQFNYLKNKYYSNLQDIDYSSGMKALFSIINRFVREYQQKLQDEFEYNRQTLILDATDHRLVQEFFNLNSNKSPVGIDSIIFFFLFNIFLNSNIR